MLTYLACILSSVVLPFVHHILVNKVFIANCRLSRLFCKTTKSQCYVRHVKCGVSAEVICYEVIAKHKLSFMPTFFLLLSHPFMRVGLIIIPKVCELDILQTACGNYTKFTTSVTSVHLGTKMMWSDFEIKGQRSRSQRHRISNKHFEKHFLVSVRNA